MEPDKGQASWACMLASQGIHSVLPSQVIGNILILISRSTKYYGINKQLLPSQSTATPSPFMHKSSNRTVDSLRVLGKGDTRNLSYTEWRCLVLHVVAKVKFYGNMSLQDQRHQLSIRLIPPSKMMSIPPTFGSSGTALLQDCIHGTISLYDRREI